VALLFDLHFTLRIRKYHTLFDFQLLSQSEELAILASVPVLESGDG
jgi:hypothetical protein